MAQIKKESLVDQVYQQLRESTITLRFPLGSHVNVNELQAELGVSCTPIREAVNRLTQEGLMTYENNVGATVLTLSTHDVQAGGPGADAPGNRGADPPVRPGGSSPG